MKCLRTLSWNGLKVQFDRYWEHAQSMEYYEGDLILQGSDQLYPKSPKFHEFLNNRPLRAPVSEVMGPWAVARGTVPIS